MPSCIQKPQWGGKFQRAPVKVSALSMARQTVGAISSREFTVSPTGCRNPLVEQRKLSRSPLLIRLRPSSLKVGMISPGLFFGSPLLITWQQIFACGRRIKQGFAEVSLQLLQPEHNNKTGVSPLSKRRHWKFSDTIWMFNIYITSGTVLVLLVDCDCKDSSNSHWGWWSLSKHSDRFWNRSMTNNRSEVCRQRLHLIKNLIL